MKNTVRAHRNGGQNRIKSQPQNQPAPATPPAGPAPAAADIGRIVPAEAVHEMNEALEELNCAGDAAVAFVLLNTKAIDLVVGNFSGWEEFDVPRFVDGVKVLAQMTATTFDREFGRWEDYLLPMQSGMGQLTSPVKLVPEAHKYHHHIKSLGGINNGIEMETAVKALNHVVVRLAGLFDGPGDNDCYCGGFVSSRLEAAYDAAWEKYKALSAAFIAVQQNSDAGKAVAA